MGTQSGFIETTIGWLFAVLVYPGLLFGVLLALAGEWLLSTLQPLLTRRAYRPRARPNHILQPLYDTLRLAKRNTSGDITHYALRITYPAAPVLALALLPFPGSPIAHSGSIFLVLALLVTQPICEVIIRLQGDDPLAATTGGRDVGRLVVGLFPTLLAVAALVEATGGRSLLMAELTTAPETGWQALIRLLAATVLLAALPWWLQRRGERERESASICAGQRLQRAALVAFWAVLVLPMPANLAWALIIITTGTIFAYIAMRLITERVTPNLREGDAARLVWATALPIAALSLVAAML